MCKLELDATQVSTIYRNGSKEVRGIVKEALGEQLSEVLPVTERIKTLQDAINELGDDHPLYNQYLSAKYGYANNKPANAAAYASLCIITAALNEGWTPYFEGEQRWFGVFDIVNVKEGDEPIDDSAVRGSKAIVFKGTEFAETYVATDSSSALSFKNGELAEYACKQFIEIYADYCFIPKADKD